MSASFTNKRSSAINACLPSLRLLALIILLTPPLQAVADTLRAGVPRNFPPHYEINRLTGQPDGFAVELFRRIAEEAGVDIEFIVYDRPPLHIDALRQGEVDIIPTLGMSQDRDAEFLFTTPLETSQVRLFRRNADDYIEDTSDLGDRAVSVVDQNVGAELASKFTTGDVVVHESLIEAVFAVLSGETDALIYPESVVTALLRESGLENRLLAVGNTLFEIKRAIAVRKDRPDLFLRFDAAATKVVGTPEYAAIYRKWYGTPTPFWSLPRSLLAVASILALGMALLFIWRSRALATMDRKLAELQAQQLRAQSTEFAAKLQVFFEQNLYFAGIMELDGTLTEINRTALKYSGYSRQDVLGLKFWETPWWRTSEQVQSLIRDGVKSAAVGDPVRLEIVYTLADGTERITDFALTPIRNDFNEIIFLAATAGDITDRKETELALDEARKTAEKASQAKSEFLANMSHEIRSPMSAILGYADILGAHLTDPDDQVSIETIRRNGRYLLELINDVLDLSKIEAGKLEVNREQSSPITIVSEVHSLMAMRAREKGLEFGVKFEGLLPQSIYTDPVRLRQILINLAANAIKFTERGSVKLLVSFRATDTESSIRFTIVDTGIGIPEEQLAAIFQAFQQGDNTMTRRFGGTGLGLTISRQLADMLDGELQVESKPFQGSSFTLILKLPSVDESDLVAAILDGEQRSQVESRPNDALTGMHILVVDDRDDIRLLVQRLIEKAGATTRAASNGLAAVAAVDIGINSGMAFDAVVMDMQMPVMDGFAATRQLRGNGFAQPIIALTAGAMIGERDKCIEAGCSSFLSKPVNGGKLIASLLNRTNQPGLTAGPVRSVLIVDDDADSSEVLAQLLGFRQFSVKTAANGAEAISSVLASCPDAVILDMNLPDMSGVDVLDRLKGEPICAGVRFIGLSGRDPSELNGDAERFDHYLLKPAEASEIVKLLERPSLSS